MSQPGGEKLLRAVKRLSDERSKRPDEPLAKAVDRVALELDLSPVDSEWLLRNALRLDAERRGGSEPTD